MADGLENIASHASLNEAIEAAAERLLADTDCSMSRIATRCGFRSQTVLANLFASHLGMSMSAYRRQSHA